MPSPRSSQLSVLAALAWLAPLALPVPAAASRRGRLRPPIERANEKRRRSRSGRGTRRRQAATSSRRTTPEVKP